MWNMLEVNIKDTRMKSSAFIVNFEHISYLFPVFLLLILGVYFVCCCWLSTELSPLGRSTETRLSRNYLARICGAVMKWLSPLHNFGLLRRFKSCSQRVRDLRWWEFLTVLPARNKAYRLSSVNHSAKSIHYYQ